MPSLTTAEAMIARAGELARDAGPPVVAVAAAQDADVLDAVAQSTAEGFIRGLLIGDVEAIRVLASENGIDLSQLEIRHEADPIKAAHLAARMASAGEAEIVMKGFLPTSALLKAVLDRRYELRGQNTLSHCAVIDIPGYHKLLNVTDGGMVVLPDSEQKYQILENAVLVSRALGCSPVKVAVSGGMAGTGRHTPQEFSDMEDLMPKALESLDDLIIAGPVPFEFAVAAEATDGEPPESGVRGDADIFLVGSIEECNIVVKTLIQFAQTVFAGVIVGARVPVALVSRTDSTMNKKSSLALACLVARSREGTEGRHD